MADVQNLTQVILCSVPINSYDDQLDFANTTQQRDYFTGKALHTFNNLTYQRKDRTIDLPISVDSLWGVNYVMYQNANFGSKWFYAFIDRMEYISPNNSRIVITTDAWQTWQFNINFGKCYVEREHTNVNETISVEEGLDLGNEYVCRQQSHLFAEQTDTFVVTMREAVPDIMQDRYVEKVGPHPIGGIPQVVHYYLLDSTEAVQAFYAFISNPASDEEKQILAQEPTWNNLVPEGSPTDWIVNNDVVSTVLAGIFGVSGGSQPFIAAYQKYQDVVDKVKTRSARLTQSIMQIFRLPYNPNVQINTDAWGCKLIIGGGLPEWTSQSAGFTNDTFSEPKLNYFPYTFYKLTDHKGNAQTIKPEYCPSPAVNRLAGFGTPIKQRFWVTNYQGGINTDDLSIVNNTNSSLPVSNDAYGSYLMGNANQDASIAMNGWLSIIGSGLNSGVSGAASGNALSLALTPVNMLNSGFQRMSSINAKRQDIRNQPPSIVGGSGNPSFEIQDNNDGVWIEKWTVNDTQANILSDFFNRYGYQINRVKVPNFKGRNGFNFVKTTDCIVTGGIPMEDLVQIKQMFNNGVTMWHDPWNVGAY